MEIRCKRCFKKYDDSFPLCPRCGKKSEYKSANRYNTNYKRYDTEQKSEKKREKTDDPKVEKDNEGIVEKTSFIKSVIESYDTNKTHVGVGVDEENTYNYTGEIVDDKLDEIWLLLIKKTMPLFDKFLAYRYCKFCGNKSRLSDFYCSVCKNGYQGDKDNSIEANDNINPQKFSELVKGFISLQNGSVDFELFLSVLNKSGFDYNNWNIDGEFKTGIRSSKYTAMLLYSVILIVILISMTSNGGSQIMTMWFLAMLVGGNLFAIPLSKRIFSESITINNLYISVKNNQSRYELEAYGTNPKNVKSIELIYNSESKIQNIIFRSKKGSDVKNLVYSLSLIKYANRESLVEYILLFACKNDISLYISKEELESDVIETVRKEAIKSQHTEDISKENNIKEINKIIKDEKEYESLFVRIDTKVEGMTLTELEFDAHLSYLKDISKEAYFMGGGFVNETAGMIIFSAIDKIDANEISKEDPLIKSGAYTYELKEWNIVIKSKKNYII